MSLRNKILELILKNESASDYLRYKLIGNMEVKTVNINNVKEVTINDCILVNSKITNNGSLSIKNNVFKYDGKYV